MTDFRDEVRGWLAEHLVGEFAPLVGTGGPGREHEHVELRTAWEQELGRGGWIGLAWPVEAGGRGCSIDEQVVFHEEYAKAGGPARIGHMGEQLAGPTIIAFGTQEQKDRFLPGILAGTELWCQGYSEPGAGSDLAGVRTRAELHDDGWHVTGQKVWTSLAHLAQWCFVLARTEEGSSRHKGLSFLLVPMDQPGIDVRPIVQLTGTSEFNEVFFDGALTAADNLVGAPGDGWRVAMGLLAFERGVSTLGQQVGFTREYDEVLALARANASFDRHADELVEAWAGLQVLKHQALRTLSSDAAASTGVEANVNKLLWAPWHQRLGELAMKVKGPDALLVDGELDALQNLFLFTRSDTIYGGSNEVQRNVVAERGWGLPRDTWTAP
ncbi:MAG: acyl-CoA dehydrogenase family protein [Mycobacteriales bacterium]|nr:acyl-CoA dehydrogenase family protein [Mycobacteriales bacterium]